MKRLLILQSVFLAIVSPCHDGEFQCASGTCVPGEVICDFKKDCEDGSDEEFCGSCDFESHSCGWNDTSEAQYRWRQEMANVTSIPGQDHTTGTPWGHVMYIDGKQEAGFSSEAILEYSVDKLAALGCRISFWYHIYDNDEFTQSSRFELRMVRGDSEEKLLELSKHKTDGWENATALIGNQPEGYKLVFSFRPPFRVSTDVMLDDIRFESCWEGDIPAGSDQLSCDFEEDICSWYHDHTASLLWKWTKVGFPDGSPGHDHTTGTGNCMFIAADGKVDPSTTARLISYPQPAGQVICVSFWYHIHGSSIGSLKFITKRAEEPETVVWIRNGTQGSKWRFADLTFTSDTPIQFILQAVVGGKKGTISIDDVMVSSSDNGYCPAERECTFQSSLCGLQPQPSSDFSWSRTSGTQPGNSSGPATDHTLGTEQGYYLSAQLWHHPVGSRVAMVTGVMELTPPRGECWRFWYYMEGSDVGELSFYLQTLGGSGDPVQLWSRRGDQGKHWRHARVTVFNPDAPYQVIFEAVVGDGSRRDIGIDDLTVLNGACPPTGFCDFEMDYCGWVNSPPAQSGVEWDWLSGQSGVQLSPAEDHSTSSDLGHYVFFLPSDSEREELAHLESESMQAVDRACLEFWHYANGWRQGDSDIVLTVFVNETNGLRSVWNGTGYLNKAWHQARVDYSAPGPHQLILEAKHPKSSDETIALDDIHIMRDMACTDVVPTTTPSPPTSTTAPPASPMDCSFEQGLCNWEQETSDELDWALHRGLHVDQPWDGPLYDRTIGNNQGFYLLLNGSGSKDGESAVISVPVQTQVSHICVGFWYYMLGPSVSHLDLLVQKNSTESLAWTRQGSQDSEWMNAQVTISMEDTVKLMFTGHRNTRNKGFIAIDDVTVSDGACANTNLCGFDHNWCGFEVDVSHFGRWARKRGTKHRLDHTYRTESGFYMTVLILNANKTEVAQLFTPELSSTIEMCIRFWYWLPAGSSDVLSVHVLRSGEQGPALWERSGAPSTGWEVAELTVSSPIKFQVVFRAVHTPGTSSTLQLDDVSIRGGACSPMGSCDFESGQCTWVNVPKTDGHDWVQADGRYPGPPTDHTTQTPEGGFLLSPSQLQNHSSQAHVVSEWIQAKDPPSCLTLWYHMDSSDSGTLRVYVRSGGPTEDELIFQRSSGGPSWTRLSDSLMNTKPFQVLIEADSTDSGFIAIDDIRITPGLCPVNETSGGYVGCSFENGTCGWEDISVGPFQWQRDRNATETENTGPSVDHTLGTELGWYMAVEPDRGEENSYATVQSPAMKQASSTCTLHFYYHMFGEGIGQLKVLLQVGSRTTPLWWLSGDQGDIWRHGEVTVGRTPEEFTILFEATRTFSQLGDIAIDDIDFFKCTLPEPQPLCPEDMFTCDNKVCVEHSRVCDYSNDCGDESDETNCEQHGIVERCSFEQGLCSWARSEVDTLGAEWTYQRGQTAWPLHGPPRDHTQNTAAGHYVIPGTEKNQTSEILSNTLLPSSNCTVRFYYYSLDDAAARLTVISRTLQTGNGDTVLWLGEQSQSYSWQRAEVTISTSANSKIVFRYERGDGQRGFVAVDDISFSKDCVLDPINSQLPATSPTSAPPTSPVTPSSTSSPSSPPMSTSPTIPSSPTTPTSPTIPTSPSSPNTPTSPATPSPSTPPTNPCQSNTFFCWRSEGILCIPASSQCDYRLDCPLGEDEDGCGPCTFESGQCQWSDTSAGQSKWQRQRASNYTVPPTDHTTDTGDLTGQGYFMRVNFSQQLMQDEVRLLSSALPPSSPYCLILFHFHMSSESAGDGSLRVLMQQTEGSEAILWSRSHNTVSQWTPEYLPLGRHQQPYKILFSSKDGATQESSVGGDRAVAVDDISFLNCENSFQPPALSAYDCSFDDSLCGWVQGAEDELNWLRRSGPTDTPNTGPAGDHTTGTGQYLYIESSPPSDKGSGAWLKSLLLPPAGERGYCFTFWYHMFGATVGSLKIVLQTANPLKRTLVWQQSGSQGNEWLVAQSHVTVQEVHQVILEAAVGGEAGDIAIDDIALITGPCPVSDLCDFEKGSCNWQQQTNDDSDWVRQSGPTPNAHTGPDYDHTTSTAAGHYYYLPSSATDLANQTAKMASQLYPAGKGECVQLWYHMYGGGIGTLNVYQQSEEGGQVLLFSQRGDQGQLWRFAQASLLPRVQAYRIVVEGVKAGPTQAGDMAFDDVRLIDSLCPSPGYCDFESSMCDWSNVGGMVDRRDWLRGRGASANPNTGPSVDHTTNSAQGYYLYVDSSVGQKGDFALLISEVLQSAFRGHCLKFWYHMYGSHVGTLKVYTKERKMHTGGDEEEILKWTESGNLGDRWLEASVFLDHGKPFRVVFVYQKGQNNGGDVALDDITILPGPCSSQPPTDPPTTNDALATGLGVGLTLSAGLIIIIVLFMLNRKGFFTTEPKILEDVMIDQNSVFDLHDCKIDGTQRGSESSMSFYNSLYDPSTELADSPVDSSHV